MRLSSRHALLPTGLATDVVVETDGPVITEVRPATPKDPPPEPGLLLPGLVNAHLHLELGWAAGQVPGGKGLADWVGTLLRMRPPDRWSPSAQALAQSGTVLVSDVSNTAATASALSEAGLAGIVQHELLGMSPSRWEASLAAAAQPERAIGRLVVRPSPHATYSTPPALIQAAARPLSVPASIHLSEDSGEAEFTRSGTGPFAELLAAMGIDGSWWRPPGCSPAEYLGRLGVLGPTLLAVHGVHLDARDRALLADSGTPLALCPRSNQHVGGILPDVPALLASGVRCCLGTDSLASSPDLDVLGEIPVLASAFPQIGLERWLAMATREGALALGFPRYGRIAAGAAPGLLWLGVDHPSELLASVCVPRKMVVPP